MRTSRFHPFLLRAALGGILVGCTMLGIGFIGAGFSGCAESTVDQKKPGGALYSGGTGTVTISTVSAMHSRVRGVGYTNENTSLGADVSPDAGGNAVTVNGLPLHTSQNGGLISYYLTLSGGSTHMHHNGGMNVMSITGPWGNFTDSMASPSAKTQITGIAPGDTLHKGTGFTIGWSPTGDGAAVAISVADTGRGARDCGIKSYTADPGGTVTFSPADLACRNTGRLMVTVDRGYYRRDTVAPKRYVNVVVSSSETVVVYLAP